MNDSINPIEYYDQNGREAAALYDRVNAETLHAWMSRFLPQEPAVILDIGAGSGRDAQWLAQKKPSHE
jgi:ubiquinone/menaquinone biosynthesis C-methylase UbiE